MNAQVSPLFQKKLSAIVSAKGKTDPPKKGTEGMKGTKRKPGGDKKKKQSKPKKKKAELIDNSCSRQLTRVQD